MLSLKGQRFFQMRPHSFPEGIRTVFPVSGLRSEGKVKQEMSSVPAVLTMVLVTLSGASSSPSLSRQRPQALRHSVSMKLGLAWHSPLSAQSWHGPSPYWLMQIVSEKNPFCRDWFIRGTGNLHVCVCWQTKEKTSGDSARCHDDNKVDLST